MANEIGSDARLRLHGQGALERVPQGLYALAPPLVPKLVAIAGRNEQAVAEAAERYGFERWTTDWRDVVADPAIGLFDNGGPNSLHAEPTIAAAEAGKHVLCEKPLGRDADESYEIWQRVAATGVKHLCGFNYRFVPAVRLARELIEAGELGEIRHFRGRYLQDWGDDPSLDTWRFQPDEAGSGALGDLGTHVVDLARFLVGEIATVSGLRAHLPAGPPGGRRPGGRGQFEIGAIGTIEATRLALGRRNAFQWEINGSKASIAFDMERLNELQVFRADGDRARGFKTVLVSETDHPFWASGGRPVTSSAGARRSCTRCTTCSAIANDADVAPYGATFEDGYRASEICDAIVRSGETGEHASPSSTERLLRRQRPALRWRRRRTVSSVTAKSRMPPVVMKIMPWVRLSVLRPLAIVAITSAPKSASLTSPRPPKRLVPPITAARSRRSAASRRRVQVDAVQPRREHDAAEPRHRARDHEDDDSDARDVDPARRAASALPPTA